jgi:hypothetical protein
VAVDAPTAWRFVEALSNAFYDPLVFWSVPFALAVLGAGWRWWRSR